MDGGNVFFVQVIDVLDNTTISVRSATGKAAFRCVVIPVGGMYSRPEIGDYGMMFKDREVQLFMPIELPDTEMASKIYYQFRGGASGIMRSDGYFYVTKNGEIVCCSGKQTSVNILKKGVDIIGPAITLKTPGMNMASSGNETDTSFSLTMFSGPEKEPFLTILGGDVDDLEREINDIAENKYVDVKRETPYSFNPLMSNILNIRLNTPTLSASTPIFNKETKFYEDGRVSSNIKYTTGTPVETSLPTWTFPIDSTQYNEDNTMGESFFKERTYTQNGYTNIMGGKFYHPVPGNEYNANDFTDLGFFAGASEKDQIANSNIKFLLNYNADKIAYYLVKGIVVPASGEWKDVFNKYETLKTPQGKFLDKKYTTNKIYVTDNGIMVSSYIELVFGTLSNAVNMPAQLKSPIVPTDMALKSAIIKWNSFGDNYKNKNDNDVKENSILSGYLEIWWEENGNPEDWNWLYKAKGHCVVACHTGYTVNGERYPTIAVRELINIGNTGKDTDRPYGLYANSGGKRRGMPRYGNGPEENLILNLTDLQNQEDKFINQLRPDKLRLLNNTTPGNVDMVDLIKYDHYISQVKYNGISVETKRISNVSGECPVIDQNDFYPKPLTYQMGKVVAWNPNWKYRNVPVDLASYQGFYSNVREDEGETVKISMVAKQYLEQELHNMKAVITGIGKYFINMFASEDSDFYDLINYKSGRLNMSSGRGWLEKVVFLNGGIPGTQMIDSPLYTYNLRGALWRKRVKNQDNVGTAPPGAPSILEHYAAAAGVDENSALKVATTLTVLMSKLWSNKLDFYNYAANNFYFEGPDVYSDNTSGNNGLFSLDNRGAETPSDISHPDYGTFSAVGFDADRKVSNVFDIVNDPIADNDKVDNQTKRCFPAAEDALPLSYPGFDHMLKIMKMLRFNNINQLIVPLSLNADDPISAIKVAVGDGVYDLLDELFTVE